MAGARQNVRFGARLLRRQRSVSRQTHGGRGARRPANDRPGAETRGLHGDSPHRPPFDWDGSKKIYWYRINDAIRAGAIADIDGLFDFAAVVGQPAPNAHLAKYGGHPDAAGCQAVADAYWAAIDRGDPNLAAARAVIFGTE